MDVFLTILGATSFGLLLTVHASVVWTLWSSQARARAILSLAVPPAAFVYALKEGLRVRALIWLASLLSYSAVRWLTH